MNSLSHPSAPLAASLVSESASTSVPDTEADLGALTPSSPAPQVLPEPTSSDDDSELTPRIMTPTAPGHLSTSVSGQSAPTPSPIAHLISDVGDSNAVAVETTLMRLKEAFRRGDRSVIEDALIDQAAVLGALGVRLLAVAAGEDALLAQQAYMTLGFRAMDLARKTLGTLNSVRGAPVNQTNVQVNLAAPATNEFLEARRGS